MSDSERDHGQKSTLATPVTSPLSARQEAIRQTIAKHFDDEIAYKHEELNTIDEVEHYYFHAFY